MTDPTYEREKCTHCDGTGEVLETRYAIPEYRGLNALGEIVPVYCYWGRAWMQRCPKCQGKASVVWQVHRFEAVA